MHRIHRLMILVILLLAMSSTFSLSSDELGLINIEKEWSQKTESAVQSNHKNTGSSTENDTLNEFYGWVSTLTANITPHDTYLSLEITHKVDCLFNHTFEWFSLPIHHFRLRNSTHDILNLLGGVTYSNYTITYGRQFYQELSLWFTKGTAPIPETPTNTFGPIRIYQSDIYIMTVDMNNVNLMHEFQLNISLDGNLTIELSKTSETLYYELPKPIKTSEPTIETDTTSELETRTLPIDTLSSTLPSSSIPLDSESFPFLALGEPFIFLIISLASLSGGMSLAYLYEKIRKIT